MQLQDIKSFNDQLDNDINKMLPELEAIYKDIHSHPELSMQEFRTAKIAADHLRQYHYDVTTGVGVTGVVGTMKNGEAPIVMLRADMDALPVTEDTDLSFASKVRAKDEEGVEVGVSHVCGHDLHVTWLIGVARLFSEHKDLWHPTLKTGLQAMITAAAAWLNEP